MHKLAILLKTMIELINWAEIERKILKEELTLREKKIFITVLKLLGLKG